MLEYNYNVTKFRKWFIGFFLNKITKTKIKYLVILGKRITKWNKTSILTIGCLKVYKFECFVWC